MIQNVGDERLVLLEMLGTDFRLYLRCEKCRCVFLRDFRRLPPNTTVVCPNCFATAPVSGYQRAVGMVDDADSEKDGGT